MNIRKIKQCLAVLVFFVLLRQSNLPAAENNSRLYETGFPYIKYFAERSLDDASGFKGLTRSYQLSLGNNSSADENMINNGAVSYDQDILGRIRLEGGNTDILDTYVAYFKQLNNINNPLINANGNYYDGNNNPLTGGPYRVVRILGRDTAGWWNTWDWCVDTGAAACLVMYSLEGYQFNQNSDYKDLAVFFGDYILKLQDSDGGIRYGPRGIYHASGPDFFWNLKSTEQNERAYCALQALYQVTQEARFALGADALKAWLKGMYDFDVHLFHTVAEYNGSSWIKKDFSYVATDVTAYAPLELIFSDTYFGGTQEKRDAEVDAMFTAIEQRTAFLDGSLMPKLFRFSVSQTGNYGSVEWSAQMALAYLRAAQNHHQRGNTEKTRAYLNKYNALVNNLESYFSSADDDPLSRIAPYASYLDGTVAAGVPTGTGYFTFGCRAALASAYYAFAKAGYDPSVLGGGMGVPQTNLTLDMKDMPWYAKALPYNSSAAASIQMIVNYMRKGAVEPYTEISQNQIYEYAKGGEPLQGDLTPLEIDKAVGHFDPYDILVSNWADLYDSWPDGNPFQGYNFSVDTYDPNRSSTALNDYLRDICHWMAYSVIKEAGNPDSGFVAHPNTPAIVPLFGSYDHWSVVKGYAASADPCPQPRSNPYNTPDFTVYGLWFKDPAIDGIGKDSYKTAAECAANYFLPVVSQDGYNGKFVQIAEPPPVLSHGRAKVTRPQNDEANLRFVGAQAMPKINRNIFYFSRLHLDPPEKNASSGKLKLKKSWKDIVDGYLLSDKDAIAAFSGTRPAKPIFVRRADKQGADYYLVPFNKKVKGKGILTSAVVILDAQDGHFKEATWTQEPEVYLPVSRYQAVYLVRRAITSDFFLKLRGLNYYSRYGRRNYAKIRNLYLDYARLLSYLNHADTRLFWDPQGHGKSAYFPTWEIDVQGYLWQVTQEGKVVPQGELSRVIAQIGANRVYLDRFLKTNSR